MKRFLLLALKCWYRYGQERILAKRLDTLITLYSNIIEEGLTYHQSLTPLPQKPGRGKIARRTGHNLLIRLRDYCGDTLRFLTNPIVPFTHNQAGRDIRSNFRDLSSYELTM